MAQGVTKIIAKWLLSVMFLIGLLSQTAISQTTPHKPTQTAQTVEKGKQNPIRDQAVFILKDCLLNSKSIATLRQRADVIADASSLLWDYDKSFASDALNAFIELALSQYAELASKEKRTADEDKQIRDWEYGIKGSLKVMMQKDSANGITLQNKYFRGCPR